MASSAGRPKRFDTEQILDRAMNIFWQNGFANTTTRELETELSLNQSSLYNSFGSKARFFEAVMDRYEMLASRALIEPLEQSSEGIHSLLNFFDDLLEWVNTDSRRGCLLINLMAEDGGSSDIITTRTSIYRNRVKQALQNALKRAENNLEITPQESESRANLLLGLALGLNIAARGGSSCLELTELVDAVHHQIRSWNL